MDASTFDRLHGPRRNKKLRNITMIIAALSGFLAFILAVDPLVSGDELLAVPLLAMSFVCFLCTGLSIYFHMRFVSRD